MRCYIVRTIIELISIIFLLVLIASLLILGILISGTLIYYLIYFLIINYKIILTVVLVIICFLIITNSIFNLIKDPNNFISIIIDSFSVLYALILTFIVVTKLDFSLKYSDLISDFKIGILSLKIVSITLLCNIAVFTYKSFFTIKSSLGVKDLKDRFFLPIKLERIQALLYLIIVSLLWYYHFQEINDTLLILISGVLFFIIDDWNIISHYTTKEESLEKISHSTIYNIAPATHILRVELCNIGIVCILIIENNKNIIFEYATLINAVIIFLLLYKLFFLNTLCKSYKNNAKIFNNFKRLPFIKPR